MHDLNPVGKQQAAFVLAGVAKLNPDRKYKTAMAILKVWSSLLPAKQAPAVPKSLAMALTVSFQLSGLLIPAVVTLLCYTGILRISECLGLRMKDFVFTDHNVVLCFGHTKRGMEQTIEICDTKVVSWLLHYLEWLKPIGNTRLFRISYSRYLRLLKQMAEHLGFGSLNITTHSLRRGGASELLRAGMPVADICTFGRWASTRSAAVYLRRRETALIRMSQEYPPDVWNKVQHLSNLGLGAWAL